MLDFGAQSKEQHVLYNGTRPEKEWHLWKTRLETVGGKSAGQAAGQQAELLPEAAERKLPA